MKVSFIRNLQIGFGLSLLLLIGISVIANVAINNLLQSARLVDHSTLIVQKLEKIISTVKDAETGQRGFLLTGQDEFLTPYLGATEKALKLTDDLGQLAKDNPEQQQNMALVKIILSKRLDILKQLIDQKNAGAKVTIIELKTGKNAMDALRIAIDKAENDEKRLLNTRLNHLKQYTSVTPLIIGFAALLGIGIALFSYIKISNGITEKTNLLIALANKEQETASINEELTAANEELVASNEKLISINEELILAQQNNSELNEQLASSNEELTATNEELYQSHQKLENLNKDLESKVLARTRELAESEKRFRVILESIPQIAWTNDRSGEITFYNQQWYNYTGLTAEQTRRNGWNDVVHPDDIELSIQKSQAIHASGNPGEMEVREKRADGQYRWHLVRIAPVKNESNEVAFYVGTATDIHEYKQLQQQKDDFISIASHELKTPITTLKAALQLLSKMMEKPNVEMLPVLIAQANKSVNKVTALIDSLLNVSKLSHGQLPLHKRRFNIAKVIDDCCHYVRAEGAYTIVFAGDLDLEVNADTERIEQVIVNLINNAIKYAPQSKEIVVSIQKELDTAKISVIDKGLGIATEKLPHLFDRYYQGDNHGVYHSGMGLGLYISSEIIKKHGGKIGVISQEGRGSTFWFSLPIAQ